jgi:hypothetical protein
LSCGVEVSVRYQRFTDGPNRLLNPQGEVRRA